MRQQWQGAGTAIMPCVAGGISLQQKMKISVAGKVACAFLHQHQQGMPPRVFLLSCQMQRSQPLQQQQVLALASSRSVLLLLLLEAPLSPKAAQQQMQLSAPVKMRSPQCKPPHSNSYSS